MCNLRPDLYEVICARQRVVFTSENPPPVSVEELYT